MTKIIEQIQEAKQLHSLLNEQESVWVPVWKDHEKHPLNNDLSFIYIRIGNDDYLLSLSHSETLGVDNDVLLSLVKTNKTKWVFQSKRFLHSLDGSYDHPTIYDIDSNYFLTTGQTINYDKYIDSLIGEWVRLGYRDDLPCSIPIYRWLSVLQNLTLDYLDYTHTIHSDFSWYNSHIIPTLCHIERNGVRVDTELFFDRFGDKYKKHVTKSNTVYTEYNPYIATGRPSSRYAGINFGALNKSDGTRKCFIPSDRYILMDYDAYHPRLVGKLIGYKLPKTSVHKWLADQYGTDYELAKKTTFRLLYGGIDEEFMDIPFFAKTDAYINRIWDEAQRCGYLQTLKRKIPLDWVENPNPQKVFNYLLQAIETERNFSILGSLLDYIKDKPITFTLYNYDSFLLDVHNSVSKSNIAGLQSILSEGGFPVKFSSGMNFDEV